jgi:hypothetical protein
VRGGHTRGECTRRFRTTGREKALTFGVGFHLVRPDANAVESIEGRVRSG